MKIGAFIYGFTWGGATRRLLSLLGGFVQKGHQVELVVVDPSGPLASKLPDGVGLYPLKFGVLGRLFRFLPRRQRMSLSKFGLARYFRQDRVDVFLSAANHAHITSLSAKLLARSSTPFVLRLSSHVSASLKNSKKLAKRIRFLQAKRLYPNADLVIAVSRAVAQDLAQTVPISPDKIRVVYNPVYTSDLTEQARQSPDHPWLQDDRGRDVPVLLAAGRLRRQKGFDTIIRAVHLANRIKKMRLIILGEGKARGELERLVAELDMGNLVDLPGFKPNPASYMARADLFCHASTFEGLPGVVIEALATGCPVVCTDSPGGAREILEDGLYGLLAPVGDYQSFSKAIIQALDMTWDSEKLKKRASDFSLDKAVNGYLSAFEDILNKAK